MPGGPERSRARSRIVQETTKVTEIIDRSMVVGENLMINSREKLSLKSRKDLSHACKHKQTWRTPINEDIILISYISVESLFFV